MSKLLVLLLLSIPVAACSQEKFDSKLFRTIGDYCDIYVFGMELINDHADFMFYDDVILKSTPDSTTVGGVIMFEPSFANPVYDYVKTLDLNMAVIQLGIRALPDTAYVDDNMLIYLKDKQQKRINDEATIALIKRMIKESKVRVLYRKDPERQFFILYIHHDFRKKAADSH